MLGTPTAKSLRSFYLKCGSPWLVSEAQQRTGGMGGWGLEGWGGLGGGVDMQVNAFVCVYWEKLRGWNKGKSLFR